MTVMFTKVPFQWRSSAHRFGAIALPANRIVQMFECLAFHLGPSEEEIRRQINYSILIHYIIKLDIYIYIHIITELLLRVIKGFWLGPSPPKYLSSCVRYDEVITIHLGKLSTPFWCNLWFQWPVLTPSLPPKKTPQTIWLLKKLYPKFAASKAGLQRSCTPTSFSPPNTCLMYYMFRTRHLNSHIHTTGIHLSDGARTLQHVLVRSGDQQRNSSEPGRQQCIDPNKETQDKYRFCRFCSIGIGIFLWYGHHQKKQIYLKYALMQ